MQREIPRFVVSDLPDGTTHKLICSYLSLFGNVEKCIYDESSRSATVVFSESDDPCKIMNARHRFLGSPICVTRAGSSVPSSASSPHLSVPASPSFVAPLDSSVNKSDSTGCSEAKVHISPPGTSFHVFALSSNP